MPTSNNQPLLKSNAFYLLGARIEDTLDALTEAYEERLDEAANDEHILQKAYQAVCATLPRLGAEVSGLPGVEKTQIDALLNDTDSAIPQNLPALSTLNLIAHRLEQSPTPLNAPLLNQWLERWDTLVERDVLEAINQQRGKSGFPVVHPEAVNNALSAHRTAQVKALIHDPASVEHYRDWLSATLKQDPEQTLLSSSLLVELANACETLTTHTRQGLSEQILCGIDQVFASEAPAQAEKALGQVQGAMQQWHQNTEIAHALQSRRGLASPDVVINLCAALTEKINAATEDDGETVVRYQWALSLLENTANYLAVETTLREELDSIIAAYKSRQDTLLLTAHCPELIRLCNEGREQGHGFYNDSSSINQVTKTKTLINEAEQQLNTQQEGAIREAIYNEMANFAIANFEPQQLRTFGSLAVLSEIKRLVHQYSPNESFTQELMETLNAFEHFLSMAFVQVLAAEQDMSKLQDMAALLNTRITDNPATSAALSEVQDLAKKAAKEQLGHSLQSIASWVLMGVVALITLAQCMR